jgi:hypothetical protein
MHIYFVALAICPALCSSRLFSIHARTTYEPVVRYMRVPAQYPLPHMYYWHGNNKKRKWDVGPEANSVVVVVQILYALFHKIVSSDQLVRCHPGAIAEGTFQTSNSHV